MTRWTDDQVDIVHVRRYAAHRRQDGVMMETSNRQKSLSLDFLRVLVFNLTNLPGKVIC